MPDVGVSTELPPGIDRIRGEPTRDMRRHQTGVWLSEGAEAIQKLELSARPKRKSSVVKPWAFIKINGRATSCEGEPPCRFDGCKETLATRDPSGHGDLMCDIQSEPFGASRRLPSGLRLSLYVMASASVLTPNYASGQTFIDVFAGRARPERTPASITADQAKIDGTIIPARLRIDIESLKPTRSATVGVRIGRWKDWIGVAVDVASLNPNVERQTIRATANLRFDQRVFGQPVVIDPGAMLKVDIPRVQVPTTAAIAALAMVRVPGHKIAPYALFGPAYLITDTSLSGSWGVQTGAGLRVGVAHRLSLFGEYRYTSVTGARTVAGRIDGSVGDISGTTGDIKVGVDLRNHSLVGGLGLEF